MKLVVAAASLAGSLVVVVAQQGNAPAVRILAPEPGSYVSGDVVIKASIEPADTAVSRMTFFVDGRLICSIDRPPFECGWNAGRQIQAHVFRVAASLSGERRVAQTVRTKGVEYAETEDVDVVHVTVTVHDGARFATGLPREAFRVFEDDVPQPITYFVAQKIPLELVAAIDVSESMTGAIDQMKENVKHFISAMRPDDRLTLVAFNDDFFVLARPAMDLASRLRAVDRLTPWGATSLHDVLLRSLDLLGTQAGRRAVVMFTDGDDTSSWVSREMVERRAETSDALLYMIGQGRATQAAALKALCERLSQKSGGQAFFPRTMEDVRGVFDGIAAELSNQYLIGYVPPSTRRDSKWHRIRVQVSSPNLEVRARQGYRFR